MLTVAIIKKNGFYGGSQNIEYRDFDPSIHTLELPQSEQGAFYFERSNWILWDGPEPPEPDIPALAAAARLERNRLLTERIDPFNAVRWGALTEENRAEWSRYYQELLDVPQQSGFPLEINWPEPPAP